MSVKFEYPKKFTFSEIKTKTKSDKPEVKGVKNYLFRLKTNFEGISINPADGVITINKKAVPGNYILEIDCVDSVTSKMYSTKHIVFVRDPNIPFPGDDEISDSEEDANVNEDINSKNKNYTQSNNMNNLLFNQNQVLKSKSKKNKEKTKKQFWGEKLYEKYKNKLLSNNKSVLAVALTFAITTITLLSE